MNIQALIAALRSQQKPASAAKELPALFGALTTPAPAAPPPQRSPIAPVSSGPLPQPSLPAQQPQGLRQLIAAASQNAAGNQQTPVAPPPLAAPVQAPTTPSVASGMPTSNGPAAEALRTQPLNLRQALTAVIGLGSGGVMGDSDSPVIGGPSIGTKALESLPPALRHAVEQNMAAYRTMAGGGTPAPATPYTPPPPRLPTRPLFGGNPTTLPQSFFNPTPLSSAGSSNPAQLQALQQLMGMQQGMGGMMNSWLPQRRRLF